MEHEHLILSGTTVSALVREIVKAIREELLANPVGSQLPNDDLLTRVEAAKLLHITLPTLRDHTKGGKLQGYRIGARVLYKRSEVLDALQEIQNRRTPRP